MSNFVFIMMGGSGTRMGGAIPKQYVEVEGHPVFWHIVNAYMSVEAVEHICIVSNAEWIEYTKEAIGNFDSGKIVVTEGGRNRSESVLNALKAIKVVAKDDDVVLIHDATHPYLDKSIIDKVIQSVKDYGGATVGMRQYDTCYSISDEDMITGVIPRKEVVSGASPEGFLFGDLKDIYFDASYEELEQMTSVGAMALSRGIKMKVIATEVLNLKLTYPSDMELYQILTNNYLFK